MRKSAVQSALRYPLSAILGSESKVRLLRELARHGGEVSGPDLIRRAGLSSSSGFDTLNALARLKIVDVVGSQRSRVYRIAGPRSNQPHPFAELIQRMFDLERERYDEILDALRFYSMEAAPGLISAWIYGSVARGEDTAESDIDVAIVQVPTDRDKPVEPHFSDNLLVGEDRWLFRASFVTLTSDDVLRLASENDPWWSNVLNEAQPLIGDLPAALLRSLKAARRATQDGLPR